MTSHIHFVSVMDSPILTGKTLHRLPAHSRNLRRARYVTRRGEAGDEGGARVWNTSPSFTPTHTSGRRAHLISWCTSLSTSHVGLNFPPLPWQHGPLGIFLKLLSGPLAQLIFSNPPPDPKGPWCCPLFQTLFWYTSIFSGDPLRLNIHLEQIATLLHNWTMD